MMGKLSIISRGSPGRVKWSWSMDGLRNVYLKSFSHTGTVSAYFMINFFFWYSRHPPYWKKAAGTKRKQVAKTWKIYQN